MRALDTDSPCVSFLSTDTPTHSPITRECDSRVNGRARKFRNGLGATERGMDRARSLFGVRSSLFVTRTRSSLCCGGESKAHNFVLGPQQRDKTLQSTILPPSLCFVCFHHQLFSIFPTPHSTTFRKQLLLLGYLIIPSFQHAATTTQRLSTDHVLDLDDTHPPRDSRLRRLGHLCLY
jgi:hypothetical protein